MPSYPNNILATLISINGANCGSCYQDLYYDTTYSTPTYSMVTGGGNLAYAKAYRTDLGGGTYTWQMKLRWTGTGPCYGLWLFQLVVTADNPVGTYGLLVNGVVDTSQGQAGTQII